MPESLQPEHFRAVFGDDRRKELLFAINRFSINPLELFHAQLLEEELGFSRATLDRRLQTVEDARMIERFRGDSSFHPIVPYVRVKHPLWSVVELAASLDVKG